MLFYNVRRSCIYKREKNLDRLCYGLTSPMPEDAPVISTTFPVTSSLYVNPFTRPRYLRTRYGGKIKRSIMSATGGSKIFINILVISIALQQHGEEELLILSCLKEIREHVYVEELG